MVTRREMDVPAMVIAGVMGAVLLVGSLPFTYDAFCRKEGCPGTEATEPTSFDVSWAELPHSASTPLQLSEAAPEASVQVNVTDVHVAAVEVTLGACTDTFRAPLQGPARITVTLEGAGDVAPITFTCAEAPEDPVFRVELTGVPDIAQVKATNRTSGLADLAERTRELNRTATFTLTATAAREDGTPAPLPVNPLAPTLDVSFTLSVTHRVPFLSETPEVLR